MAVYKITYSDLVVGGDIPRLDKAVAVRIKRVIMAKLTSAPDEFGKPLRRPYHGYWVLRMGNYRIVYSIFKNMVRITAILHRDRVYQELIRRLD